jgi:hypothetical protein
LFCFVEGLLFYFVSLYGRCRIFSKESLLLCFVRAPWARFSRVRHNRVKTAVFRAFNNSLSGSLGLRRCFRVAGVL